MALPEARMHLPCTEFTDSKRRSSSETPPLVCIPPSLACVPREFLVVNRSSVPYSIPAANHRISDPVAEDLILNISKSMIFPSVSTGILRDCLFTNFPSLIVPHKLNLLSPHPRVPALQRSLADNHLQFDAAQNSALYFPRMPGAARCFGGKGSRRKKTRRCSCCGLTCLEDFRCISLSLHAK